MGLRVPAIRAAQLHLFWLKCSLNKLEDANIQSGLHMLSVPYLPFDPLYAFTHQDLS